MPDLDGDGPDTVRFSIRVALADAVAFDRSFRRSAAVRRALGTTAVVALAVAGIVGFAAVLAARVALVGSDCDLDASFDSDARLRMLLTAAGAVLALEAAAVGVLSWFWLRDVEAKHRVRREKRPGVDPADPELREAFRCGFNRAGFRFAGHGLDLAALWASALRVEETVDHMSVYMSFRRAYVIPKREVAPTMILAVRDLAREASKLTLA